MTGQSAILRRVAFVLWIALAIVAGFAAPAAAQVESPTNIPLPPVSPATSPLNGTFLEPVVRLGQDAVAAGVLPRLRYVDAFATNPVGGLRQGVDNSGVVIFGADFDLNRIAHIPGAVVHVGFAQLYGHELSTDEIGSRTKVQSFYYPYKQFELTELSWEQSLFGDRLNILAGRSNATGEFARSTYGCRFENVADCPFEMTQYVGGFPGFPYVNWGGRVRVRPTPNTYVKAGAYETNSVRNRNSGFDFDLQHSTGFVLPVEVAYETSFRDDAMPRHYKAGFYYNSTDYNDPLLNTRSRSRAQFGGSPLVHTGGREGAYAMGDQVVWRPDTTSERAVALFAGAGGPFDKKQPLAFQGLGGVMWTGPSETRPGDQIGFLANYIRLSNRETGYLNGLLVKNRSKSLLSRNGFVFEVNYGWQIVPGVVLQPTVQYLLNPDTISRTNAKMAPRDALVLGLKLSINANQMLGLPQTFPGTRSAGE